MKVNQPIGPEGLQVGKKYANKHGDMITILERSSSGLFHHGLGMIWHPNGKFWVIDEPHEYDLIGEVQG